MTSNFKNASIRYALTFIVLASISVIGCKKTGGTAEPTPIELRTNILTSGSWSLASIKVDDVLRQDLYPSNGMGLTFKDSNFTTVNGSPFFPTEGIWFFQDGQAQLLKVGDLDINVLSLNTNSFVAQFQWNKNTIGEGKVASISGQYVFTFFR